VLQEAHVPVLVVRAVDIIEGRCHLGRAHR
jgi:hypothetical protein